MQKFFAILISLGFLALMQYAHADALFVNCPTVFNNDVSNITMYTYIDTGGGPVSSCGSEQAAPRQCGLDSVTALNVLVDNTTDDLISCSCDQGNKPGIWTISVSTPLSKTYNITSYILNATSPDVHSADYSCVVKRVSTTGQYTVPDFSPLLLPLIMFTAIFMLRRKGKR